MTLSNYNLHNFVNDKVKVCLGSDAIQRSLNTSLFYVFRQVSKYYEIKLNFSKFVFKYHLRLNWNDNQCL